MTTRNWKQYLEKAYPYGWAFIAAYAMHRWGSSINLALTDSQISNTTTIASILMGFLGTSYGILLSATSRRIEWAKGRQQIWRSILRFFNESFIANFTLCVFSIVLSTVSDRVLSELYEKWILTTWAFLITLALVSFFRAMRILLGLLRPDS